MKASTSSKICRTCAWPAPLWTMTATATSRKASTYELEGLREMLNTAMQAYANEVSGTPIVYNADSYPYFFIDANADGAIDDGDAERYNAWTPRLLKAAYNYQVSKKDPGAFAHGGKYIIELMHDSIMDLNEAIAEPVDLSNAHRIDAGHFAGSEEAFRHWDEDGAVPGSCAKCHSSGGLPMFLERGCDHLADTVQRLPVHDLSRRSARSSPAMRWKRSPSPAA